MWRLAKFDDGAKYAKYHNLANDLGFSGKVTFAPVTGEPFQRMFSRGSDISRFYRLPF